MVTVRGIMGNESELLWPGILVNTTLTVHSENAVLPNNVRTLADRLGGLASMDWTDCAQTDFYDVPEHVDHAVDVALAHFDRTLRSNR